MTVYADTNFFTNLLVDLPQSGDADALAGGYRASRFPPWPVPRLLHMELINALQRLVFEARHGAQKILTTPELALLAEARFVDGLMVGEEWRPCDTDSEHLLAVFDSIVHRRTAQDGFRTYDVLHVASALVLNCDTFWSFDVKARKLAKLEGLGTN
jgi:predicted nucleic acid-binding protein